MRRALALVLWCTPGCALLDALASNDAPGPLPEPNEIGTEGEGEGEGLAGEGEPEGPCQSGAQLAARAVAVGFDRSCALGCDGTITCWGAGTLEAPAGPFVEVTVSQSFACGRRADGAVAWFGEQGVALEGAFTTIRAGQGFVCGLDDSASLHCDGDMSYPSFALPTGPLSTLAAGWAYVCGERLESGALLCGGTFSAPEPPAVELHDVGVGSRFACGLDASGEIYCFAAAHGCVHHDRCWRWHRVRGARRQRDPHLLHRDGRRRGDPGADSHRSLPVGGGGHGACVCGS
jgi:hypothetical protein